MKKSANPDEQLTGRVCHTLVEWQNTLIVYGGHVPDVESRDQVTTTIRLVYGDVQVFDLRTTLWRMSPIILPYRTEHSAVVYGDKMYVFGGYSGFEYVSSLLVVDLVRIQKKNYKRACNAIDKILNNS